jgi:hypothetical protein
MNGVEYDPPIPACVVHDCIEVAKDIPDLTHRMAQCNYTGSGGWRNYGPIHGGGKCSREKCECLVASSFDLPFFVYSPDKKHDHFFCGCAGWD